MQGSTRTGRHESSWRAPPTASANGSHRVAPPQRASYRRGPSRTRGTPARLVRRSRASCARRGPAGEPPGHTPRACSPGAAGSCSPGRGVGGARAVGGPAIALVRFSGGGSGMDSIAAVTLEDAQKRELAVEKRELARWSSREGELPEALAAPIWARYALFGGHPGIWAVDVGTCGSARSLSRGSAAVRSSVSCCPLGGRATDHPDVGGGQRGRRVARVRCRGAPRHLGPLGAGSVTPRGGWLVCMPRVVEHAPSWRSTPAGCSDGGRRHARL